MSWGRPSQPCDGPRQPRALQGEGAGSPGPAGGRAAAPRLPVELQGAAQHEEGQADGAAEGQRDQGCGARGGAVSPSPAPRRCSREPGKGAGPGRYLSPPPCFRGRRAFPRYRAARAEKTAPAVPTATSCFRRKPRPASRGQSPAPLRVWWRSILSASQPAWASPPRRVSAPPAPRQPRWGVLLAPSKGLGRKVFQCSYFPVGSFPFLKTRAWFHKNRGSGL